jgi:ATP-dependent DNA helicase RecQ
MSAMVALRDPQKILQTVFGYDSFRHNQQEIVEHVLAGKDAVVLMPTGAAKVCAIKFPLCVYLE